MNLRKKSTAIKLLFTLLLIYFLYNFIDVTFEDILNSIVHAKKRFLMAAALLMPVTISLQIIKWYQLLRDQGAQVPFRSAAVSHLSGMLLISDKLSEVTLLSLIEFPEHCNHLFVMEKGTDACGQNRPDSFDSLKSLHRS